MKCIKCGSNMIQKYKSEKELATIRSRVCKNCGYKLATIEISKEDYKKSVETLNNIIDLLKK